MSTVEALLGIIVNFAKFAFRPSSRLWPLHLVVMVFISLGIYLRSTRTDRTTPFLQWAFPKQTYLHPSHRTDIKLFVFGQFLTYFGFFQLVAITTFVTTTVMTTLGGPIQGSPTLGLVPVTILLVLVLDFAVYWVHRLHHETSALWPFHSVHHSAEVMTPITVYRKHPIYDLISLTTKGALAGTLQGVLLALFVDEIQISTIASVNAGYFLFNIAGANLRHSHIWLSYGRVLSHVLISPAQHQIHHSVERRHFNKNYGEVFAFWDWMFGTLYVPSTEETIRFGLSDTNGTPIEQPHTSLRSALWVPIADSWRSIRRSQPTASTVADAADTTAEPQLTGVQHDQ